MPLFRRRPAAPDDRRAMFDARVAEHDRDYPGYAAAWRAFAGTLLAHGGTDVVPPGRPDPIIDPLRELGEVVAASDVVVRPGERGACHANTARLWRSGEIVAIGTGYALSPDGLWREHSWGVDADGRLVETTVERVTYFGLVVTGEHADGFADWVDPR